MSAFLSYSSLDDRFANELDETLLKFGVNIVRDSRELQPTQKITTFMRSIEKVDYAIMLISTHYLRSKPCVFEFTEFLKKENAAGSMLPVITGELTFSATLRNEIIAHIHAQTESTTHEGSWLKRLFTPSKNKNALLADWLDRFNTTWEFLTDTKLFNFAESKAGKFFNLLEFMHCYDADIDKELAHIRLMQDRQQQGIAYDKLIRQHPGSYWVIRYRASLSYTQAQYKEAIYFYEQFMSKFSEPFDKITIFYDIGLCYYHLGDYEKAIKSHKEAIRIFPNAYLSHRGLGDIYFKQKRLDEAYAEYQFSNRFDPNYLVLKNLARIDVQRGKFEQAAEWIDEALAIKPDDAESYMIFIEIRKAQQDMAKYWQLLNLAYEKFPDNYAILTEYAAAKINGNEDFDSKEIMGILKKSLRLNPDHIPTRVFLGLLISAFFPDDKKELRFARDLLLKTLDMEHDKDEKDLAVSALQIIGHLLGDDEMLATLKEK